MEPAITRPLIERACGQHHVPILCGIRGSPVLHVFMSEDAMESTTSAHQVDSLVESELRDARKVGGATLSVLWLIMF